MPCRKENETMSTETMKTQLENVAVNAVPSNNPMDFLNERQRIALAGRWAGLKDSERDQYAEFATLGITDSATLYCIHAITGEANSKIFSESRAVYLGTMLQWYVSLTSSEAPIKKFAESELEKLRDITTGPQQLTLLSALKAKLLDKRTFLPETQEKAFRALCRFYGYDVNMVK
jgi:hypothetical protein